MELVKGQIVTSRKGRDVTHVYAVAGLEGERALLADGAKWTLAGPKRKNPRHVQPTGTILQPQQMDTDLTIKTALRQYTESRGQQQGG